MSPTLDGPDGKLDALADRMRSLCDAALEHEGYHLVSKLGLELGNDIFLLKDARLKLVDFIRERMSDRFDVIAVGRHGNIHAVVRKADASAAAAAATAAAPRAEAKPKPRFNRRFWRAFSVPLTSGVRIMDRETLTFTDSPEQPDAVAGYIITPAFVAPETADDRDELITANIGRWLEGQGLEPEQFLVGRDGKSKGHPETPQAPAGRSLLEALMTALDRRQQASLSLSLDVVSTLMRTRVGP